MTRPVILGVDGFARSFGEKTGRGPCIEPENERDPVGTILRPADDPALRARPGCAGLDVAAAKVSPP